MKRTEIIKSVLEELERAGVAYCVLRNYDFLLENREVSSHAEKSVDLAVSQKDLPLLEKVFSKHFFLKRKPQFSLKHKAYFRLEKEEIISFDVQVGGVHWNDLVYLSEDFIIKNRVKKSFFTVPGNNDTWVMLLVHSLLGKRYFKQEYKEILISLSGKVDENYVLARLEEIFNKKIADELFNFILQKKFDKIIQKKHHFILFFILKSPSNLLTFSGLFFRWIKWKKFFSSYPLISFIGPDGAGKSTQAQALADYLRRHEKKVSVVYTGRGKGQLLPIRNIGRIYKQREKKKDAEEKKDVNKYSPRALLYTLAAPIFTLDLLLRYLFKILPRRRTRQVVISDRYCSDIILMKYVPLRFKKMLLRFFPQPTFTFYLYNSPEILHQRRPEEAEEELQRQMNLFSQLKPYLKPREILTVHQEETEQRIEQTVLTWLIKEWY